MRRIENGLGRKLQNAKQSLVALLSLFLSAADALLTDVFMIKMERFFISKGKRMISRFNY